MDQLKRLRKEIAFVISAEPVSRSRERRARHSPGEEINLLTELDRGPLMEIQLADDLLPLRPGAKGVAAGALILNKSKMAEASKLKPVGLTTRSCADFDRCKSSQAVSAL